MLNRREFVSLLAAASFSMNESSSLSAEPETVPEHAGTKAIGENEGFPNGDYTPFSYLDNPWHTWNLHPSGVFRSLPGIGFGLYYPAGPGGYFDFHRNGVYSAELALGFRIGGRTWIDFSDFEQGQLTAKHHTKNLLIYTCKTGGMQVECAFFQVNEDALAIEIKLINKSSENLTSDILALHKYQLGGSQWWGGDGISGGFAEDSGCLWTRSFAAGTVFAVVSDERSVSQHFSDRAEDRQSWLSADAKSGKTVSYGTDPLHAGLLFAAVIPARSAKSMMVVMARGVNLPAALKHARVSLDQAGVVKRTRLDEDSAFWSAAPRLSGDWPAHWRNGWVYDFETLRTMVRKPIGLYKHKWDAMQIQAPRNVLAETSIDMWALSYADPAGAKDVFLGQFLDAIEDNVPCMREDGVMNMVAADGSECGTSISWCFPFFCAESIFNRTRDREWLRQLYPRMSALLQWTLKNRVDSARYVVGKCSWETGMDTSKRFQIQQPTGGEVVDFLRLVELQAAASHAGGVLAHFAVALSKHEDQAHWRRIQKDFADKTQSLWKDDWFHDFDSRAMKLVENADRDPSQAAPAFCGIATPEQKQAMLRTLKIMYERMQNNREHPESSADEALNWSSFVLPFVESAYAAGDRGLASATVEAICERIYRSMDRRTLASPDAPQARLGWPGTSCEIWGAHGAFGGEVYGWGAVMPAHIIRTILGFRESGRAGEFLLSPGFGPDLSIAGRRYGLDGLTYASLRIGVNYTFIGGKQLKAELKLPPQAHIASVSRGTAETVNFTRKQSAWEIPMENHEQYRIKVEGLAVD